MLEYMKFEVEIAGADAIALHLKEKQDKYVAAFTNIQNLKELVKSLKKDVISREEIKEMDDTIAAGEGDKDLEQLRDKFKQMYGILDNNIQQIKDNENAAKLYKKNIVFLQKHI